MQQITVVVTELCLQFTVSRSQFPVIGKICPAYFFIKTYLVNVFSRSKQHWDYLVALTQPFQKPKGLEIYCKIPTSIENHTKCTQILHEFYDCPILCAHWLSVLRA